MIRTPKVIYQSERELGLKVQSKSEPGVPHMVSYKPDGERDCSCPGHHWFKIRKLDQTKMCRHHKYTTIPIDNDPVWSWKMTSKILKKRSIPIKTVLNNMVCAFPGHRNPFAVHCSDCPLYPTTCNIHPIKTGRSKPLVWKLQTAVYNGRRKDAIKIVKEIIKNQRRD